MLRSVFMGRIHLGEFLKKIQFDIEKLSSLIGKTESFGEGGGIYLYILALEDRRFFRHHGIDFYAIFRELFKKIRNKPHGGAGTITM